MIKVRKVKLEGIKVVGKIDLPEKPVKETLDDSNDSEEIIAEKPVKESRAAKESFDRKRTKKSRGTKQKQLSYEERQKLQEREKFRARRKKEYEEKKRKKKFYEENLQPKLNLTPKKNKKKQNTVSTHKSKKKVAPHKNPIRRLWAWLNGEYDKF